MHLTRDDGLTLSDDPARLDVDRISSWLASSYWAGDRDRATVARSLAGSLGYGVYTEDGTQIALARAVTDRATFAWLCDVVVDEAWRARGIGRWLVGAVAEELRAMGVKRIALTTRDAHRVYQQIGFEPLRVPASWLEIDVRPTRPDPADVRAPATSRSPFRSL
ncbi:MAG: GNAT family N-acetyltransferase [Jatrophihabitantaceae bacterium]